MSEIKVSVIIPVYNTEKYLADCLTTILNQTLKEIEIICVNDGSTDRSLEILYSFKEKDERVHIIDQPNQGAGAARNAGLKKAKGEYLSFLDADDFYEDNMLERSYEKAKAADADICVFYADLYDDLTKEYKPCTWAFRREYFTPGEAFGPQEYPNNENIFRMFNGWAWDKLFRREFVTAHGLEYQNLRTTNDMYFVFMALAKAGRIVTLDECLIHQRVSVGTSLSRTREKSWDCFYLGLKAMHEDLKASGLYKVYRKAFVNWVVNFSLWQLNTMHGMPYCWTYELLKEKAFEEFGVTAAEKEDFYVEAEYYRYQKIMEKSVQEDLIDKREWYINHGRQLDDKIRKLEQEKEKLEKQLRSVKNSKAYRIGRLVTKPLRLVKRFIGKEV